MQALLIKRAIITHRSLFVLFIQIAVPIIAMAAGVAILLSNSTPGIEPELSLGVNYFKDGSASSLRLRAADFRRTMDRDFNLSLAVRFVRLSVCLPVCLFRYSFFSSSLLSIFKGAVKY